MTLFERAKSFGVCFKRVHARHVALYESRKDISGMHPTFFENDMALALAMERIAELEAQINSLIMERESLIKTKREQLQYVEDKLKVLNAQLATSKAVGLE